MAAERTDKKQAETTAQHLQHVKTTYLFYLVVQEISKIPLRREPVTTTKTTTSGDGWVQEVREETGKPLQTTFRQYTDEEAARQVLVTFHGSKTYF